MLFLVLPLVASSVYAYDFEVNGIYYSLDPDEENVVSVTDYSVYESQNKEAYVGNVVIPAKVRYGDKVYTVTRIGGMAFRGCTDLKSITMPNTIIAIRQGAFMGCSGLASVTIPNSVIYLESCAFEGCSGLRSVIIPNSVVHIENVIFGGCTGLAEIAVESGNPAYDSRDRCNAIINTSANSLISGCKNTIIPNSVTTIGGGAFFDCSGLTSVTIPNSVTSIGSSAFRGCSGLTSVTIPNSVTSIGSSAFRGCSGLTSVTIPNSVTSIGEDAFSGCSSLTSVDIPNSVTSIGKGAFFHSGLTAVVIPNSVTFIGNQAFACCYSLTSVVFNAEKCADMSNAFYMPHFNTILTSLTIGDKVTIIPPEAFAYCSALTSVSIPNSVTSIGYAAFSSCHGLASVVIGKSVTSIDYGAFSDCSSLSSVVFNAEKCAFMGRKLLNPVFSDCPNMATLTIGDAVNTIPDYAFCGWEGLTSVTISNNVSSIGDYVFCNCKNLCSLTIGAGVKQIGSYAIGYEKSAIIVPSTPNISEVAKLIWLPNTPPDGYAYAKANANYCSTDRYTSLNNCKEYQHLSSMFEVNGICYVPVSPSERTCEAIDCTYAPEYTVAQFSKTINYKGVQMMLKGINPYTCYHNLHITKVIADFDGLWGDYAFCGCSSLESITIPNNVESIGQCTFEDCSALSCAKIGSGLKSIPYGTFSGCSSLPSITIPKNVNEIENFAFDGCKSLADVYIEDREDELSLGSNGSSPLFSGCPLKTVYIGGNITYPTSSNKGYSPFYRNTSLEKVIITDKETEISVNEFYGCTGLKYITMGDGIEKIGDWAFSGCSSLDFFRVGSNVKTIGKEAFSDCTAMTKLITTAPVPPTCGSQALDDINKWTCELFVNKESIDQYKAAEQWKEFFFISEYDGVDDVSVDTPDALYEVYNLQGIRVGSGMREAEVTADTLPHGVYILVSPQGRKKLKI